MALLTKLLLNPASRVYLRGLERDLGVSSNTVRLELNKLQEMHLIQVQEEEENAKVKHYVVNQAHPMFQTLRGIILQFVGLDQIVDQIIKKLGNLDQVYLTGELAEGKNSPFVDLLWAVFHLVEELEARQEFDQMSQLDRDHLCGDMKRVFGLGHRADSFPIDTIS